MRRARRNHQRTPPQNISRPVDGLGQHPDPQAVFGSYPRQAFHLGGTVFELTYGGIGDFLDKRATGAMVKAVLTSMHEAHTAKSKK